jgi:hypothetical protein
LLTTGTRLGPYEIDGRRIFFSIHRKTGTIYVIERER